VESRSVPRTAQWTPFDIVERTPRYRYAYLLVGDRGLAEDLLQEALTKTYVAWRRLNDLT